VNVSNSDNIGPSGFEYLKNGLLKCNLDSLYFKASNCGFVDDKCTEAIVRGLSVSKKCTEVFLDFSKCFGVTNRSLALIVFLAERVRTIKKLYINFSYNPNLTRDALILLRKAFDNLPKLSHLGLYFEHCEKLNKKAKEELRFHVRNFVNIQYYELY